MVGGRLRCGIAAWFLLPDAGAWLRVIGTAAAASLVGWLHWRGREERVLLRLAAVTLGLAFVFGVGTIWARSGVVGTPPLAGPTIGQIEGRILIREEQPAEGRVRITLAVRESATGRAVKVRLNVPEASDRSDLIEGALIRTGARLLPPAPPLVPGGYDFARRAWFERA